MDDITSRVNADGEEHRYKLGSMMLQQGEEEDLAEGTEKHPKKWDRNQECIGAWKLSEKGMPRRKECSTGSNTANGSNNTRIEN